MFPGLEPPSLDINDYKKTVKKSSDIKVLFPSLVFQAKVEGFEPIQDELIGYSYGERGRDPEGASATNINGWQSKNNYHEKQSTLLDVLARGLSSIGGFRDGFGLKMTGMWININPPGSLNNGHTHPNCDLSGVMWIKSQPECGKIEFENPNYYSHPNIAGYSNELIENTDIFPAYDFAPQDGEILLFPSYLRHGVHVNNSKEDRISVAFNCNLVQA